MFNCLPPMCYRCLLLAVFCLFVASGCEKETQQGVFANMFVGQLILTFEQMAGGVALEFQPRLLVFFHFPFPLFF